MLKTLAAHAASTPIEICRFLQGCWGFIISQGQALSP